MIVEFVLFLAAAALLLRLMMQKPQKFPPGPTKWPIVGNRFQMKSWGSLPHQYMNEAAKRYGDIVGLIFGRIPLVLISGLENIKEVSLREEFSGRPISVIQKEYDKGSYGMIMIQGEKWKEQRRFTLRHLKDLGLGRRSLEGIAHEEIQAVFTEMENVSGGQKHNWANPVPVHDILGYAGINVLWHIIAGKRYSVNDPTLKKLLDNVKRLSIISEPGGGAATTFPVITKLLPHLSNLPEFLELRETVYDFIKKEIKAHRETLESDSPRDFIDTYITEIEKRVEDDQTTFEYKQLDAICVDLFMAGSDTIFNSITFSLLYMILYPEAQRKVQEELDRVVGKDRMPSLEDRSSLPYVGATIDEVLRMSSVTPLSLPHAVLHSLKDAEFKGYIIPKDTRVILNLNGLHRDPQIWGDPDNFRPERFLDENGKHIKHEALIPFGFGKRQCIGEALARNNLYLFFTCLMQRYTMKVPDNCPKPTEEPLGGLTLFPTPFTAQIKIRD